MSEEQIECRHCSSLGKHDCSFLFPYTKGKHEPFNAFSLDVPLRFALLWKITPDRNLELFDSLTEEELKRYIKLYVLCDPTFASSIVSMISMYLGNTFKFHKEEVQRINKDKVKWVTFQNACKDISKKKKKEHLTQCLGSVGSVGLFKE